MKGQKFDDDLIPAEEDTAGSSNSAVMVMKNRMFFTEKFCAFPLILGIPSFAVFFRVLSEY